MLLFILIFFSVAGAFAQDRFLQVIRVEEVMPLLSTLINAGTSRIGGAAHELAGFVPGGGNLQGTVESGVNSIMQAVHTPFAESAAGATFMKGLGLGKAMPVIGAALQPYGELKQEPVVPTLAPLSPPEEVQRMAADLGIKTAAAKNTLATMAAMPAHIIAAGANKVAATFEDNSNMLLGTPNQINQLLQFQHSLFNNYLAGMNEATTTVPPHSLRDELSSLMMIQPQLTRLVSELENPLAAEAFSSLDKAFTSIKDAANTEGSPNGLAESLLIDPLAMKVAFSNIVLNFLNSITGSDTSATERVASNP